MTAPCPTFAFRVTMELAAASDSAAAASLRADWARFLEERGLYAEGGGAERPLYVVASEASQATENDRVATRGWLAARPELRAWTVGELEDLGQGG